MSAKATKLQTANFRYPDLPEGMAYWAGPRPPAYCRSLDKLAATRVHCSYASRQRMAQQAYN